MERRALVGRQQELARLRRAAASARRRRGAVVLVAGDAGVGKTAIVERALEGRGLAVLRGTSGRPATAPLAPLVRALRSHPAWATVVESASAAAGGPVAGAIRTLLAEESPDRRSQGDAASSASGEDRDGASTAVDAACHLVVELSRVAPIAIVLDDLQAADHATLEAVQVLASESMHEALLVIGIYRTDELSRNNPVRRLRVELRRAGLLEEIVVEALDREETLELAAGVLGAAPDGPLGSRLVDRSQGIPLYVEELAAALVADGAVSVSASGATLVRADLPIPDTLRDSILVRIEGLPAAEREALLTAALIGDDVDPVLVDELVPSVPSWVAIGLERGILVAPDPARLRFRHSMVREVLRDDLPAPERRARHRQIAALLAARDGDPLAVADHWLAAGEPQAAVPLLVRAGAASQRIRAYRDAASAYRRALDEDRGTLPSRPKVLERLAESLELAGAAGEAARTWELVARDHAAGGASLEAAWAHARCARALETQGRWRRAIDARVAAADEFAAAGLPAEAATERLAAAAHLRSAASFSAARELVGVARAEAEEARRPDLLARAMGLEGNVLARMGQGEAGIVLVRQGLALALDGGFATAAAELYQRLADSLEHAGKYDPARAAYIEGADYCRTQSLEPGSQLCFACMCVVLWQTGEWTRAEQTARSVLSSGDATLHARAAAEGVLGIIAALRGAGSRARPHLEASLQIAHHIELAAMELLSTWGVALCDVLDGDSAAAAERCRRLLERWERTEERHYVVTPLRWAATVFGDCGDTAGVRACADALARIAGETAQPEAVAALATALGAAASAEGDHGGAAAHFVAALETLATRTVPLERAEIGRRAGIALVRAGQRTQGVAALVTAARTARRLGATPLGAAIATDLAGLGESVERRLGRREARRLADGGLTRRELEVVRLVARGMTSRAIGHELFISARTVEMHIGSVLAKLDCRTRAEAVQRVALLDGGSAVQAR